MKKILYTITFISIFGLFTSCDDKLEIDPLYAQDADNFFNTPEDYQRALIGAYDLLQTSYLTQWIGEIASDNAIAGGESVNDTRGLHEIETMTHGGVNEELRSVLRYNYAGITRVNYIFENQEKIDFEGKDQILAEAYFLRAYYYFELTKFFGAVPLIIDRRIGIEEATSIERAAASDIYSQIEADLISSHEVLDWSNPVKGRVTKGAALALLGKVYLYQDKFTEAAEIFDRVIDEGPYGLVEVNTSEDFAALFSVNEEGNQESVFEIQYTGLEGGSYDCFVCLEGNVAVGFHGIRQYSGPIYGDGNSYNLPTQDLYDEFDPSDIRRNGTILDIEAFATSNPSVSYAVGGGGHTGYFNNKYIKRSAELGLPDNDLTSPVNYRVIRFADVLLMAAEAHNRKSGANDALAQSYLNQVRQRAGMPAISASGQSLTAAIWKERRLELSGEGYRFWDLVRTGQAAAQIDGFESNKNELFPIPQTEIDLAGGTWDQNQGY
ncbi:RagB/SusD family nutrient uptake outer membrane protein [Marivirga harenae]|uniref:RagB/SusD family nutrient uptake outer membrane protein n=1 Tax=Marivirga harenae TaxID=2010992 RepID=UPI0026DF9102|nr:RagB/SusD family nutrient uptake outer membrane protein [Marivirga harenae]WKV11187.1 RagB/SusD family nutrient uptake outer membrane protein [Marivirga harenae]|tara:strand:+ start:63600 stop:65081 length:1482 start_codon:yes stop_codon:yes gene_type:complete